MQLRRPSDKEVSEPMEFRYLPDEGDLHRIEEKRKRTLGTFKSFVQKAPFAVVTPEPHVQRRIAVPKPSPARPSASGLHRFMGATGQLPLTPQAMAQPPGLSYAGPSHCPSTATSAQLNFSTVNLADLSVLGVPSRIHPAEADTEASITDALLNLQFEGGTDPNTMELGGLLDDATYTSLECINTAEFRQLLTEGPPDNQSMLLTYPESITRLVNQRGAEGEQGGSANSFNGLMGILPNEEPLSMVDLDFSTLLTQLNS
uniref:RELA n=1 Tax=Sphenodon punctatus TaxID=8508 RepID=A0A8D0GU77_SPHPU